LRNPPANGRLNRKTFFAEWGRSIFGSLYTPDKQFTMLTWYLDEAGNLQDSFIVVCGWSANAARWENFEIDWKLMLASYNLPYGNAR
jgi:hypothetical protein